MCFEHISCTMHIVPHTDESWLNVAQKKFYAYTDFKKLEGTLLMAFSLTLHDADLIKNREFRNARHTYRIGHCTFQGICSILE